MGRVMHTRAFISTHPTSVIDLLFFTARARHFPPSLVILFFPSLRREGVVHPSASSCEGTQPPSCPAQSPLAPLGRSGLSPRTHGIYALGSHSGKDGCLRRAGQDSSLGDTQGPELPRVFSK